MTTRKEVQHEQRDTRHHDVRAGRRCVRAARRLLPRVSTREQAERGGTEEGFSIPAQREANARKADELGTRVVREFIDAGESARSADRDGLQDMLAFIAATRVTFCIVHKLDRLARSVPDEHVKGARRAAATSSSSRR